MTDPNETPEQRLNDLRADLMPGDLQRDEFELRGHTLVIREMTLGEYERFTSDSLDGWRGRLALVFDAVTTKDGRQVFGDEHLESFMSGPGRGDSLARRLHREFLRVNGYLVEPEDKSVDEASIRSLLLEAGDAEEAVESIVELLGGIDEDEEDESGN